MLLVTQQGDPKLNIVQGCYIVTLGSYSSLTYFVGALVLVGPGWQHRPCTAALFYPRAVS